MSWLDMLESFDSTKVRLSKVLETRKGREAWNAAVHGVAELELSRQLKNSNKSVSHMSISIFLCLKYGILYVPIGKLDASL